MIVVPLPTEIAGSFTLRTRLGGTDYLLRFAHNVRSDSWTLDVTALGGTAEQLVPIVTGAKIFIGNDLLRHAIRHALTPPGRLLALSADGTRRAPTRDELGERVRLYYLDPGETF